MIFTLQFIAVSLLIVLMAVACWLLSSLYRDFKRFVKACWHNSTQSTNPHHFKKY